MPGLCGCISAAQIQRPSPSLSPQTPLLLKKTLSMLDDNTAPPKLPLHKTHTEKHIPPPPPLFVAHTR